MNHFSKTFFLTRFYLRKDWVTLVSWLALMLLMTVGVAAIYPSVYPNLNNRNYKYLETSFDESHSRTLAKFNNLN